MSHKQKVVVNTYSRKELTIKGGGCLADLV